MSHLETAYYELGRLDLLAENNSIIHRLDPRVKVITTLLFIIYVVSFDKYEVNRLLPFFLFPVFLIGMADLPFVYLIRKLIIVSPFVLFIGIFNPFFDQDILVKIGTLEISGGWISLISILLRFMLTVGATLLLIATTAFPAICMALDKLGAPKIFTVQLLMLYRYLFVLIEESIRMKRAYTLRAFSRKKLRFPIFKHLLVTCCCALWTEPSAYTWLCYRGPLPVISKSPDNSVLEPENSFTWQVVLHCLLLSVLLTSQSFWANLSWRLAYESPYR